GLIYQVQALSDEEKALALQQHAQARGFILTPEVGLTLTKSTKQEQLALMRFY
ncbi:MAG: DnaA regulatory inactivator Hda, partial [Polynucleobacter sp. 39-46-10]